MVAYNFKANFAWLITDGIKRQTIRYVRKRPTQVGDTLQLYTGMRTSRCTKLRDTTCTRLERVHVGVDMGEFMPVRVNGQSLRRDDLIEFALRDGFQHPRDLFEFFCATYGLPWGYNRPGECLHWHVDTRNAGSYWGIVDFNDTEWNDTIIQRWYTPSQHLVGVWPVSVWPEDIDTTPNFIIDGIPVTWQAAQ